MNTTLRISQRMYEELKRAGEISGFTMSEIARKALRKHNRLGVEVPEAEEATRAGQVIYLFIPDDLRRGRSSGDIRNVLNWYLKQHRIKKTILFLETGRKEKEVMRCTQTV